MNTNLIDSSQYDDMAKRTLFSRQSINDIERALDAFANNGQKFHRIGTTQSATAQGKDIAIDSSSEPFEIIQPETRTPHTFLHNNTRKPERNNTLVILDASYNPPSRAHAALALSALSRTKLDSARLLLLLGTRNADKHAPVPASYVQRLVMLSLFSLDLQTAMKERNMRLVPVDIGVASQPYHADKSAAIEQSETYDFDTKHIQVMGYDTIIRVLAPRYYPDFKPPLSALDPLFGRGHSAFVVLRPDEGKEVDAQRQDLKALVSGKLKNDGFREEWKEMVEVEEIQDAAGISSTNVRKAAEVEEWQTVEHLCTPSVAAWIKEEKLYQTVQQEQKEEKI